MVTQPHAPLDMESHDIAVLEMIAEWRFGRPEDANGARRQPDRAYDALHPSLRRDFEAYIAASPEDRALVRLRLPVLVHLRSERKWGDVEIAAKALGMTRANIYRLTDRMEEMGPVVGLLPNRRRGLAPSLARDGFGAPVDGWIADALGSGGSVSIAAVRKYLIEKAKDCAESGRHIDLPAPSSLKRRIHHLRAAAPPGGSPTSVVALGGRILVDYCVLNVEVEQEKTVEGVSRLARMVVAVDEDLKVVLAFGLFLRDFESGLAALARDAAQRMPMLAATGVPVSVRLRELRWVVPPVAVDVAEEVGAELQASRRPLIEPILHGERRAGARLVGLLGDRIEGYMLLTRPSDGSTLKRSHLRTMHHLRDLELATTTMAWAVDRWNEARLQGVAPLRGRALATSREDAANLAHDLATLFAPVLD